MLSIQVLWSTRPLCNCPSNWNAHTVCCSSTTSLPTAVTPPDMPRRPSPTSTWAAQVMVPTRAGGQVACFRLVEETPTLKNSGIVLIFVLGMILPHQIHRTLQPIQPILQPIQVQPTRPPTLQPLPQLHPFKEARDLIVALLLRSLRSGDLGLLSRWRYPFGRGARSCKCASPTVGTWLALPGTRLCKQRRVV